MPHVHSTWLGMLIETTTSARLRTQRYNSSTFKQVTSTDYRRAGTIFDGGVKKMRATFPGGPLKSLNPLFDHGT